MSADTMIETQASSYTLVASAPGKVILFGEHSVVYGKLAIAASVSLRTSLVYRASIETGSPLILDFSDVGLHLTLQQEELDLLRQAINHAADTDLSPSPELNQSVLAVVNDILDKKQASGLAKTAASAFLYLYAMIKSASGQASSDFAGKYTLSSELPIGAGLGSSASVSVVVAAIMLYMVRKNEPSISIDDWRKESLKLINEWAFVGEQVIHGNPSGVDNTVATCGGCVAFRKNGEITTHSMPPLPLLLTNTGVPRDTKTQVANVASLKQQDPKTMERLLDEMDHVAVSAQAALGQGSVSISEIGALIQRNQDLLRQIGVSHASIEAIVERHREIGYTKLVGAGGGGCVVTLLKDGQETSTRHEAAKQPQGSESSYLVQLGGPGLSVSISS